MRPAEARFSASTMTITSIRWSLVGWQVDCSTNTSLPRTFSRISTITSPSENRATVARPRWILRWRTTSLARRGLAFPLNTIKLSMDTRVSGDLAGPTQQQKQPPPAAVRLSGWGGRDRTYECRNQNPMPYHLATPQWALPGAEVVQRMPVEPLRHKTPHRFGQLAQHVSRRVFRSERCKHAGTRTGHPRLAELRQPFEMAGDFRITLDNHGLQVVTTHACGKGRYFEGWRAACQFRRSKNCCGRHLHRGGQHHVPRRRGAHRVQDFAHALGKRGLPEHEHRHVGAQLQGQFLQGFTRQVDLPQTVEGQQHGGGV